MKQVINLWAREVRRHKNLIAVSIIFLIIAVAFNYAAGSYVDRKNAVAVPDLILDNIPTVDLDFIFLWGAVLIVVVGVLYPLFFKVNELHIVLSQFSLLILIRSFFITLTHLSIPVNALVYHTPKFFSIFDFNNALFFSGHTAIPFLGFLIFRKEKIGIFFLISTVVMAITVLFMHVHYSIDVFAALFIAYGSYKIGEWLFRRID
jgi:hypothetical protein